MFRPTRLFQRLPSFKRFIVLFSLIKFLDTQTSINYQPENWLHFLQIFHYGNFIRNYLHFLPEISVKRQSPIFLVFQLHKGVGKCFPYWFSRANGHLAVLIFDMVCFLRQKKGLWSDTKLQYNHLDLPNCPSNSQAIGTLERFSNERRKTQTKVTYCAGKRRWPSAFNLAFDWLREVRVFWTNHSVVKQSQFVFELLWYSNENCSNVGSTAKRVYV